MESAHNNHEAFARLPVTVSLAEFCAWTGLHRNVVGDMRRAGEIRAVAVGSRHRYLKSEIARLALGGYSTSTGTRHSPPGKLDKE
jgi:hypothetical protein